MLVLGLGLDLRTINNGLGLNYWSRPWPFLFLALALLVLALSNVDVFEMQQIVNLNYKNDSNS